MHSDHETARFARAHGKPAASSLKIGLLVAAVAAVLSVPAFAGQPSVGDDDGSGAATGATSGSTDAPKQDNSVTLNSVEVTAKDGPKVDPAATFSEGVISSDVIRNLSPGPSMTAQTMLNQEPSIFAYTNGPLGVSTSVYFRAFNSSQFSETYDGVALNDVFNGGVTGQAENRNNVLLTANNLDSVQLYRGINNPAVNSYNSLGGTINYVPRQPTDAFNGEFGIDYGSYGTYGWHSTLNLGDWNGLKQIVSFEQNGSDGWIKRTSDRNNNFYYGATYSIDSGNEVYDYLLYNHNQGFAPFNMPVALLQQYGDNYRGPRTGPIRT